MSSSVYGWQQQDARGIGPRIESLAEDFAKHDAARKMPPSGILVEGMCRSALETPAHGFGGNANRSDRIEQLAMRDAEMLAPPLHLPALGEVDRKRGAR